MKGNLLLVDDEDLILENLRFLFEEYADEIYVAKNGKEALDIFKEKLVHCIVCDIKMPTMNGIELIKEIRKINTDVPFVFYTAGDNELLMTVANYGAYDFLFKPLIEGLEDTVHKALQQGLSLQFQEDSDYTSQFKKLLEDNQDYS